MARLHANITSSFRDTIQRTGPRLPIWPYSLVLKTVLGSHTIGTPTAQTQIPDQTLPKSVQYVLW